MSDLVTYSRRREDTPEAFASNVDAIMEISGKAYTSLFLTISLLKLPPEIQAPALECFGRGEIRAGNLPVSQGYLFAANLDCPDRDKIFEAVMKTPVTYLALEKLLTAYKKVKPVPGAARLVSMKKQIESLRYVESRIETGIAKYTRPDLETLRDELRTFLALVELRIPIAPEPPPEKKGPPQV